MNKRVFSAVSALILAFAASHTAAASTLYLNYQGLTDDSLLVNGNPVLPAGISFSISAEFSTGSGVRYTQGVYEYTVTSITIDVGGFSFFDTSDLLAVFLVDGTNTSVPGEYSGVLGSSTGTGFYPFYSGTTAAGWSAASPTPTVFTGYINSLSDTLSFNTTLGADLEFDYDTSTGLNAEISAVPEGGTFTYLALGIALLGLGAVFSRKGVTGNSAAGSLI